MLYGVDGPATADALGCWYEEKRNIIQPAAFIIDPQRRVMNITYSSGPIGRLRVQDALGVTGFHSKKNISKLMVTAAVKGFFESKATSSDINRDVFEKPFRQYIDPSMFNKFKK